MLPGVVYRASVNKQAYLFPFSLCTPCHLLVSSMVSLLCTAKIYGCGRIYNAGFLRWILAAAPASRAHFLSFRTGMRRRGLGSSRTGGAEADQRNWISGESHQPIQFECRSLETGEAWTKKHRRTGLNESHWPMPTLYALTCPTHLRFCISGSLSAVELPSYTAT